MTRRVTGMLVGVLVALGAIAVVGLAGPGAEPCLAQGATSDPDVEARLDCGTGAAGPGARGPGSGPGGSGPAACATNAKLRGVSARGRGRSLRFGFTRRGAGLVSVDVFQTSSGRRIFGQRRVARFGRRARGFAWPGARGTDGTYFVRFRARGGETQRLALRRRAGRFSPRPAFERRLACGPVRAFKLERPVFGGLTNRALGVSYRLNVPGRVTLSVLRGGRVVRTLRTTSDQRGRTYRARIGAEGLRRGDHQVRLTLRPAGGGAAISSRLTASRL